MINAAATRAPAVISTEHAAARIHHGRNTGFSPSEVGYVQIFQVAWAEFALRRNNLNTTISGNGQTHVRSTSMTGMPESSMEGETVSKSYYQLERGQRRQQVRMVDDDTGGLH
jgi:hypothetical protein